LFTTFLWGRKVAPKNPNPNNIVIRQLNTPIISLRATSKEYNSVILSVAKNLLAVRLTEIRRFFVAKAPQNDTVAGYGLM
jgi:hypothetical protein